MMRKIETKGDLMRRRDELEARIEKLENDLAENGWNEEVNRELNVAGHHLRVCKERLEDQWHRDRCIDPMEVLPLKP